MSYHANNNNTPTGPSSSNPPITNTSATNDVNNYSNASNRNSLRAIHIITPDKLRTMVLDFPESPAQGEVYEKHGIQYIWNGTHWESNNALYFRDRFSRYDIDSYGEAP